MMFAQQSNRLITHFSECITVVKRYMTVYVYTHTHTHPVHWGDFWKIEVQGSEHHKVSQKEVTGMMYKRHQHFKKNFGVNMMPSAMLVIMLAQTNSMWLNLPAVKTQMMQKVRKCLNCAKISTIMCYWSTSWSWLKKGIFSEHNKCGNVEIHVSVRWPEWQSVTTSCNPQHKNNCPAEYHKICTNSKYYCPLS